MGNFSCSAQERGATFDFFRAFYSTRCDQFLWQFRAALITIYYWLIDLHLCPSFSILSSLFLLLYPSFSLLPPFLPSLFLLIYPSFLPSLSFLLKAPFYILPFLFLLLYPSFSRPVTSDCYVLFARCDALWCIFYSINLNVKLSVFWNNFKENAPKFLFIFLEV